MTMTPEIPHPDHSDDATRLGVATKRYAILQNLSYLVVQVDDGQASRGQFYSDRAEAFEAAGLRE